MRKNTRKASSTKKSIGKSAHGTKSHSKRDNIPSLLDAHDSLLTVKHLAEMLQVEESAVRKQIRENNLPAHDHCGKYVSLRSEVMWKIRNSKCNMDMTEMYNELK